MRSSPGGGFAAAPLTSPTTTWRSSEQPRAAGPTPTPVSPSSADQRGVSLGALGVADGWHCLEVGAGAGSIARWLARRVAPTGRVIAVDLDLRHMDCSGLDNLEARTLDIVVDHIGEAVFHLVHVRAVLEHIPDRETDAFDFYRGERFITTEAAGIAVEALQSVL